MGNDTTTANSSSSTTETEDVAENMSIADYAAADLKRRQEAAKPEPEVKEAAEETTDDNAEGKASADPEVKVEGEEKPAEHEAETDPETEDVLSKSNFSPKAKENIRKRIGSYALRTKAAEAKAEADAAEKTRLVAELEQLRQAATAQQPIVSIPVTDDPNDLTAKAATAEEVSKVEADARQTLELIEENELIINRAIAKEEDTVKLSDGTVYNVDSILRAKRQAKAHIEKYVPARKGFIQQRKAALDVARAKFPALFKTDTQEHHAFQSFLQANPGARSAPNIEIMYGYALKGLAGETAAQEAAKKAAKAEPASAQPAKTASDTTTGSVRKETVGSGPKKVIQDKLLKAEKEMERTGSMEALELVNRLKKQLRSL
jgi:hypothetical protein